MFHIEAFETIDKAFDRIEMIEENMDAWDVVKVSESPTAFDGQYYVMWSDKNDETDSD